MHQKRLSGVYAVESMVVYSNKKKYTNMKKNIFMTIALLAGLMVAEGLRAQGTTWVGQALACPGWNNPASFTAGKYSGQGGGVWEGKPCPDPMTGNSVGFQLNTKYAASQLATINTGSCSNSIPNSNRQFVIMSDTVGTDPNTYNASCPAQYRLKYVPTHFNTYDTTPGAVNTRLTKSIRIGDGCSNGNGQSDNKGGAALYYTTWVTGANAMFYLYYAIVAESPTHGIKGNPAFIIRVCKKQGNEWRQINDTMCYYISSTPHNGTLTPTCSGMDPATILTDWSQRGWHVASTGYSGVIYKDWEKVVLNLGNYLYDSLQIQVYISDCLYNAHYAYAYIAGECRQLELVAQGCPPGRATEVGTITAPTGLLNYKWYASEWGVSEPANDAAPGGSNQHFTWRALREGTEADSAYIYKPQASDFRVTRRRNNAGMPEVCDSTGVQQTFRCEMTSAINPNRPFKSNLYVNLTNTKPHMAIDTLLMCDGSVKVVNTSKVQGDPDRVQKQLSQYVFYVDTLGVGAPTDSVVGDSVTLFFNDARPRGLVVRSLTNDPTCWSEEIYVVHPRVNPKMAGMVVSEKVLCDDGTTQISDTCTQGRWREWRFRDAQAPDSDTTLSHVIQGQGDENRTLTRSFSHSVEPVRLTVYNGMYWLDGTDTVWCSTTVTDTVSVFLHPDLQVTGDTIVCEGSLTNAMVRAVGVDNCQYEWSTQPYVIAGNLPAGQYLRVKPNDPKETYYVKVTSPQGCEAWDSINVYLIRPQLAMVPEDGRICPGQVATLTGSDADHYSWTASPADASLVGQEQASQIVVSPQATTTYTLIGHGSNNCDATPLTKTVTVVPLPEPQVTVTPGYIDTDNPRTTLRDDSRYSVHSTWEFEDGADEMGREVSHLFEGAIGRDSVHVVLTSLNELGCPTIYPFAIPVTLFTAWFPNAFTPDSRDGNSRFSLYTVNDYEYFHIYIYNRRGELVYESDDVKFQWDGTRMKDGEPLQQGTYVYTCRFRKPGSTTLSQYQGTITLLR